MNFKIFLKNFIVKEYWYRKYPNYRPKKMKMINDSESSEGESVLDKKQRKRKDRSAFDFTVGCCQFFSTIQKK